MYIGPNVHMGAGVSFGNFVVPPPAGGLHWWSVDDIVMGTGSEIATINDRIGTDHLTQGTAIKRATLNATGGPTGGPSMLFDGSNDTYNAVFTFAQPYGTVCVIKNLGGATSSGTYVDGGAYHNARHYNYRFSSTYEFRFNAQGVGPAPAISLARWNLYNVMSVVANGASSSAYVNQGTPSAVSTGSTAAGGVTIGTAGNGSAEPFNGHIVEVVFCTTAALSAWTTFLSDKYGL